MMMSEFIERTGYQPSAEEYSFIEDSYYEFNGNKDEFCKWWKKAQKSGEWKKELSFRQYIKAMEEKHEAEMKDKEETLEFYRPYFDKAIVEGNLLRATAKEIVKYFAIKVKGEASWRKYSNVKVKAIDNGARYFINIIENGWTESVVISDIENVSIN